MYNLIVTWADGLVDIFDCESYAAALADFNDFKDNLQVTEMVIQAIF